MLIIMGAWVSLPAPHLGVIPVTVSKFFAEINLD